MTDSLLPVAVPGFYGESVAALLLRQTLTILHEVTLTEGQLIINLPKEITTDRLEVYVEGAREFSFTKTGVNQITLPGSYSKAGNRVWFTKDVSLPNGTDTEYYGLLKTNTITAAGTARALDVAIDAGNLVFDITLSATTCALTLLNEFTPPGYIRSITLFLRQGTGSNKITLPTNVRPQGKLPVVLSYEKGDLDTLTLVSDPGSATPSWLLFMNGSWPHA